MFFCAEQSFSRIGFFHTVDHYVIGNDAQWIFMLKIFASGLIAFAFNKIQRVVKINFNDRTEYVDISNNSYSENDFLQAVKLISAKGDERLKDLANE